MTVVSVCLYYISILQNMAANSIARWALIRRVRLHCEKEGTD